MEHESLDPIEGPMGRARAVLSEYYEHRRRIRGFLPLLPPLPELLRQRSARLQCRFVSVATGCTAGVVEAAGSILAVFAIVAAMGAGAIFTRSAPTLNATYVGVRTTHSTAQVHSSLPNDEYPAPSPDQPSHASVRSIDASISSSVIDSIAPSAGLEGSAAVERKVGIGLRDKWVLRVGDREVEISEGTLLWVNCESKTVQRVACGAYDKAPPGSLWITAPSEMRSRSQ